VIVTASDVLEYIVSALGGRSDSEIPSIVAFLRDGVILIGAHAWESGYCWCQPKMVSSAHDPRRAHPAHRDVLS